MTRVRQTGTLLIALVTCFAGATCTQAPPPTHGWTLVHLVKVGQTPGPITLGGRWAFVANMSDGTVTQIERASGAVVATIPIADPLVLRSQGCAPDSVHAYYSGSWGWRACDTPYAIAWDGSSLWALDNGNKRLIRVDPVRHEATDAVGLPGTGWSIAAGSGRVWVSGFPDHALYAIDIATRRLTTVTADLDRGPATLLDNGSVWVVCVRGVDGIGQLDRIDPASGAVAARYPIEWWSTAVIASQGAIYVRGTYGGDISRVDAGTGAVVWSQPGPGFIGRQGIDELGATSSGVWMSGPTTARIDPTTGLIAERIFTPSTSVTADGGEVWLMELDGSAAEFRWR